MKKIYFFYLFKNPPVLFVQEDINNLWASDIEYVYHESKFYLYVPALNDTYEKT